MNHEIEKDLKPIRKPRSIRTLNQLLHQKLLNQTPIHSQDWQFGQLLFPC